MGRLLWWLSQMENGAVVRPTPLKKVARLFAAAVVVSLMFGTPALAEFLTLQLPLSRSQHSFSLWELDAGTGNLAITLASPVEFVGGHLDSQGNWVPDAASYLSVRAERQQSGTFWLHDDSTGELSPPNQPGLTLAQWRSETPELAMRYFALPAERADHLFSFQYSYGLTYLLSTGAVQGEFLADGTFWSYGFFEGWGSADYLGDGLIIDHTWDQGTPALAGTSLVNAEWTAFTGATPTKQVTLYVGDQAAPRAFTLYVDGGASQTGTAWWDTDTELLAFSGSVGMGQQFWLEDGYARVSPTFTMLDQDQWLDLRAFFPVGPPPLNYQTIHFRVNHNAYDVAEMYIWQPAGNIPLEVGNIQTMYSWDDHGTLNSLDYRDCWATIDVSKAWSVYWDAYSLGQGPNFFGNWNPSNHPNPPTGTIGFWVPSTRDSNNLKVSQSTQWPVTANGSSTVTVTNPETGEDVQWGITYMEALVDDPNQNVTVTDSAWGDSITIGPPGSGASGPADLTMWFPQVRLNLRISATRWQHPLRIRPALGSGYAVQGHTIQGDWSIDYSSGLASFNNYGFFDATAYTPAGFPWVLIDDGVSGGEVLTADSTGSLDYLNATDNTDSDLDNLPDWYERSIGTNPSEADTDGDMVTDNLELANGTNPRASGLSGNASTLLVYTPLE